MCIPKCIPYVNHGTVEVMGSSGGLATRDDGSITTLPNMAMLGVKPVTL